MVQPEQSATHSWTPAGRPLVAGNPVLPDYGMSFEYSDDGPPLRLKSTIGKTILDSIEFEPMGPVKSYDIVAATIQGADADLATSYHPDGTAQSITWTYNGVDNLSTFSGTPAPDGEDRTWSTDYGPTRQMTGSSPGETVLTSQTVLEGGQSLHTLARTTVDGFRTTSMTKNGVTYGFNYAAGTDQLDDVELAPGVSYDLGYDDLGRRIYDDHSSAAPETGYSPRRDYTYLPNGRLGTISGQSPTLGTYRITLTHDTEGRIVSVVLDSDKSCVATYSLFYDESDRLIGAEVTSGETGHVARWAYAYLGGRPVAAFRQLGDFVKRFTLVHDERGLTYAAVDDQGTLFYLADHIGLLGGREQLFEAEHVFLPFAYPGQLVLDGTESGANFPAISLNHHREYDPFVGQYLQPDPYDLLSREDPEGYTYARMNAERLSDPSGLSTPAANCVFDRVKLTRALWSAAIQLAHCSTFDCRDTSITRDRIVKVLASAKISCHCADMIARNVNGSAVNASLTDGWASEPGEFLVDDFHERFEFYTGEPPKICINVEGAGGCLVAVLVHEAAHFTETPTDVAPWGDSHNPYLKDFIGDEGCIDCIK